jgi:ribosome-associated heat shock protein Hsp15
MAEKVRIDKYLWSIRLFKTRSLASAACESGKVKWKGDSVKPAKAVLLNEEYEVRNEAGRKIIKVVGIIDHRVAYSEAITYYVDLTPEEENLLDKPLASSFYTGKRLSKVGRPTKQQRRDRDKFFDE